MTAFADYDRPHGSANSPPGVPGLFTIRWSCHIHQRNFANRAEARIGMQRPRVAVGAATCSQMLHNIRQVKPPNPSGGRGNTLNDKT